MKKVIVVRQHDLTDCGPACLSSILQHYGGFVPIEMIRLSAKTNQNGTSAYNLVKTAEKYGLTTKSLKLGNFKDIKKLSFPLIAHVRLTNNLNHFIVIYGIKKDKLLAMDPSRGLVKLSEDYFHKISTNIFLMFHPERKLPQYERPTKVIKMLKKYLKLNKKQITKIIILSIFTTVLGIVIGYYIKIVFAILDIYKTFKYVVILFILYLLFIIIKNLFEQIKLKLLIIFNRNVSENLYHFFINKIYNLPLNFIKSKTTGEVMTRFDELNMINEIIPSIIICFIIDLITVLIALVVSCLISIKLTLLVLLFMLLYVIISVLFNNPTLEKINDNINASTNFNDKIVDSINTIISTKYINNEHNMIKRLNTSLDNYLNNYVIFERFLNRINIIKNVVTEICMLLIYTFGAYMCYINKFNIYDLFIYIVIIENIINPIKEIVDFVPKLLFIKSSVYRINEFSLIKEENINGCEFINNDIFVDNLSFAYNDIDYVIRNLSLNIKKGEKILIQGSSGSGKSTLCNILSRQLEYTKGNIKIGNVEINSIKLDDYRKNITYIGQKDSLLTDTILNNINFERKVSDKEFLDIYKLCEIDKIVKKKYNDLSTVINESSSNISGGEKQRIILARGLINSGSIIILDEALSEVNLDMEERILKRIFKHFSDKTIIFVSHKNYGNLFKRVININ